MITIELVALTLVAIAACTDVRSRRIPNWLTVPACILGISLHRFLGGWSGLKLSLEGAGIALAVLFPVVLLRGLGAGDWKLFGALGAFVGPVGIMLILFFAVMIGGAMAIFLTIRRRMFWSTVKNLWALMKGFFIYGLRPNPEVSLDNPGLLKLPFAVATALATVIVFTSGHIF